MTKKTYILVILLPSDEIRWETTANSKKEAEDKAKQEFPEATHIHVIEAVGAN